MSPHVVTPKWNIIFLIYADLSENTTPDEDTSVDSVPIRVQVAAIKDELLKVNLSPHYNIAIITNLKDLSVSDLQGSSYFYTPERPEGAAQNMLVEKHEFIKEGLLLQKKLALKDAFEKVEQTFDATNTIVITWDHGSGYGLLKQVSAGNNIIDMLTNDELAAAIKTGLKQTKADVVIMFNCFMHNLHTLYALNGAADYFVGPESIIAHPGYDYTAILNKIDSNPEIDGAEICRTAVETIRQKFIAAGRPVKAEELIIIGTRMDGIGHLFDLVKELSRELTDFIQRDPSQAFRIKYCREACYEMTYPMAYDMIDLPNWLIRVIENHGTPAAIGTLLDRINNEISKIRMASAIGDHPYSDRYPGADRRFPPSGYSLYVPENEAYYSPVTKNYRNYIAPDAPFAGSFLDGVEWRTFLDRLFLRPGLENVKKLEVVALNSNGHGNLDV
jgi:Clostripain family